ncbi:hypothetical protein AMTR_s00007p00020440 [Amborella trichopoda]|uniref:Myb/SANT-like DNA-binding domain-containing protein n=1 Tax=Amborella trichopoda TaxID=13333 RepID=W1PC73_AMBTC|nr:hypothetical protein AMTR_s00007p00020440 [Amborella trichopoda]
MDEPDATPIASHPPATTQSRALSLALTSTKQQDGTITTTPTSNGREDCWSEGATLTLVEAWGERYLHLNRGNLKQKHWKEVAEAVNSRHSTSSRSFKTDIQCKNRIDTLKKKFKLEKAKIIASNGAYTPKWPFYARLDYLIGPSKKSQKLVSRVTRAPVTFTVKPVKEKPPLVADAINGSPLGRGIASSGDSRDSTESCPGRSNGFSEPRAAFRELARAIARFGEIYERVETSKQQQLVDLEKQRMEFTKELEYQRMQMFVDAQLELKKMKRAKHGGSGEMLVSLGFCASFFLFSFSFFVYGIFFGFMFFDDW